MKLRISPIKSGRLISILAMFFLIISGCASQQAKLLKKRQLEVLKSYSIQVNKTIDDPERAAQLIAIGEKLHLQIQEESKGILEMADELKKLNRSYNTSREELERLLKDLNLKRQKMRQAIMAAHTEAVSLTTPEEWQELMNRSDTLLELLQETPGFL